MRALVLSNMRPSAERPARGSFVRDQVAALRRLPDAPDVELVEVLPGPAGLVEAAREARRRARAVDLVHAHFGLTAWPALAARGPRHAVTLHGTDLHHPRTRRITLAALDRLDLVATASADLAHHVPGAATTRRVLVLPCGADLRRFGPGDRREARRALGRDPDVPFLLLPADPARPEKRADRARAVAEAAGCELVTLGGARAEEVPLWVNAASAVLVPSDREGFGLAAVEALGCDVPVLATPTGVHEAVLAGVDGCLCAPFDLERWATVARAHTATDDPRVAGREVALALSADAMAARVLVAWRALLT